MVAKRRYKFLTGNLTTGDNRVIEKNKTLQYITFYSKEIKC